MQQATKEKYDTFIRCFAANLFTNGTQAAIQANYMPSRAADTASRLCKNVYVKGEIARLKAGFAERVNITAERLIAEYVKVAMCNVEDFIDKDHAIKSDISRENMAAVESIEVTRSPKGKTVKFKLHDKLKALDSLGRSLGIFGADNIQRGTSLADIAAVFAAAEAARVADAQAAELPGRTPNNCTITTLCKSKQGVELNAISDAASLVEACKPGKVKE